VQSALASALVVVGLCQPIAGFVFVLDGVLIGAGDGPWLAGAQVVILALYLPLILMVRATGPSLLAGTNSVAGQGHAMTVLWLAFVVFMTLRGLALGWRARGDAWLVTGAIR
jgi:Na+-driven multidrug efflux pump